MIIAIKATEENLETIINYVKQTHERDLTHELADNMLFNAEDGEDSYVVISWRGPITNCHVDTMIGSSFTSSYRFRAEESSTEFIAIEKI